MRSKYITDRKIHKAIFDHYYDDYNAEKFNIYYEYDIPQTEGWILLDIALIAKKLKMPEYYLRGRLQGFQTNTNGKVFGFKPDDLGAPGVKYHYEIQTIDRVHFARLSAVVAESNEYHVKYIWALVIPTIISIIAILISGFTLYKQIGPQ